MTDTATLLISCKAQGTEQIDRVGKSLTGLDGMAKKVMGTIASVFAVQKIIQFGKDSVQTFSDLQEETNKFNVVFQGLGDRTTKILQELNKNFGLSELSAKKMLAGTGDILTGFGFGKDIALDLSEAAAKLGADLASFSNYAGGAEGATMALTKAMLGEAEPMKMLGVVINQETNEYKEMIKQVKSTGVYIEALGRTFKSSSDTQAKAITAIALAYKQSPNAIGDFVRSQDSIANQSRILSNAFIELKTNVGRLLNDLFSVGGGMKSITQALAEVNDYLTREGSAWVFAIQSVFIEIVAGAQKTFAVFRFIFEPIYETAKNGFQNILTIGKWVFDNFEKIVANFPEIAKAVFLDILENLKAFGNTLLDFGAFIGKAIWGAIKAGIKGQSITGAISKEWGNFIENAGLNFGNAGGNVEKALKNAGVSELNLKGFGDFKSGWGKESLKKMFDSMDKSDAEAIEKQKELAESFAALKKNADGRNVDTQKENSFLFDFGKGLIRFRETAFNAISASSQEAARLQSRRFIGGAPADPQKTQAEETKKISANSARTAQLTEDMLSRLTDISNVVGNIQTSSVGG